MVAAKRAAVAEVWRRQRWRRLRANVAGVDVGRNSGGGGGGGGVGGINEGGEGGEGVAREAATANAREAAARGRRMSAPRERRGSALSGPGCGHSGLQAHRARCETPCPEARAAQILACFRAPLQAAARFALQGRHPHTLLKQRHCSPGCHLTLRGVQFQFI
jgi:hypothetical protein